MDIQVQITTPICLLYCNFCGQDFISSNDLVVHFAEHFTPGKCTGCCQQLIEIENIVYHLALLVGCQSECAMDEMNVKSEPEFGEYEEIQIEPETSDDIVQLDMIEKSILKLPNNILKKQSFSSVISPTPNATKSSSKRTYQCYYCKRFTRTMPNLCRHMEQHYRSERSHLCDICGFVSATIHSLKKHRIKHSDTKRYTCPYCGKGFYQLFKLKEHTTMHTKVKEHKCTECGKFFARRSGLDSHLRVHTGEKRYICSFDGCDSAYMYGIDLKRHLFRTHGVYTKKYECQICAMVFPENKLLVAHMKKH